VKSSFPKGGIVMKTKALFLIATIFAVLMSAQVLAVSCLDVIQSKKTADFMVEIPELNSQMAGGACENKIPVFGNEIVNVDIKMTDGSVQKFYLTIRKGFINGIVAGTAPKPTLLMQVGECEFDTMLRNDNKGGVFAYLYRSKNIELNAYGLFRKIKFGVAKLFIGGLLKKAETPVNIACT
jgi:hypothetical protein